MAKKKSGKSPTQRCIQVLKDRGWTYQVTEVWNAFAHIRQDLFGCIDILTCHPDVGIIGIQACVGGSHAARRDKALIEPRLFDFIQSGGHFEVWSWSERGERDEQKVWTLRTERFDLKDPATHKSLHGAKVKQLADRAREAREKLQSKELARAMAKAARKAARAAVPSSP